MTPFILSCMFAFSMLPWHHPDARPQQVCEAIEFFSEAQEVDPYLMAAIAWHESTWVPDLVSHDREDFGPMQVRVRVATGNRWVNKLGGQVCTRQHVKTAWGGVECGVWVYVFWRSRFEELHPDPQTWPKRSVLGCYAMGQACIHNRAARDFEQMADFLRAVGEFAQNPWQCRLETCDNARCL